MSSSAVVSSVSGSFFIWFQDDVLPYLTGSLFIAIVIVGIILNGMLITTLRKRNLLKIRTNWFLFELTIVDFISCIFFIGPAVWVAFNRKWQLGDYACKVHGILFTTTYLVTFWLLLTMGVERALITKNFDLHDKIFSSSKYVTLISVLLWIGSVGIAAIPLTGWVTISYDFYQASCVPFFTDNVYYLSIVFVLGICSCFISIIISYVIIFTSRRKKLAKPEKEKVKNGKDGGETSKEKTDKLLTDNTATSSGTENLEKSKENMGETSKVKTDKLSTDNTATDSGTENSTKSTENSGESSKECENVEETNKDLDKDIPKVKIGWGSQNEPKKLSMLTARDKIKKVVTKIQVTKMLTDDQSDPDFHLAITYLIVVCLMLFLWFPYFIICFVKLNDKSLWNGYLSLTIIIAMISYCLKPIIYLSHNRHYREIAVETIPDNAVRGASKVRNSLVDVLNKVDKIVFKSSLTPRKLSTTVKTATVAKGWLNKSRKKLAESAIESGGTEDGKAAIEMKDLDKIKEDEENEQNNETESTPKASEAESAKDTKVTIDHEEKLPNAI